MTGPDRFDTTLTGWLQDQAGTSSADYLEETLALLERTPQRRWRGALAWVLPAMPRVVGGAGSLDGRVPHALPQVLAISAVAAVVIAAAAIFGVFRLSAPVGGPPSPSVSPVASATTPGVNRSFDMDAWTLRYTRPAEWMTEGGAVTASKDIHFVHRTGTISVGRLVAAVHPDSIYVTEPQLDSTVDTSVDGFLTWLEQHPRVDATEPIDVTVGGRPAKQVDVTLKAGEDYPQGSIPSRLGLAYFGEETAAIGPSNGETHRFMLLEIGGETAVVDVWSPDVDSFAPIAQVVLDGLVFED